MKRLALLLLPFVTASTGFSAAFSGENLVVVQVGTGAASLGSAATAAFLNEYTTAGAAIQSIALPTAVSGADQILTLSGSSTSEGFLALSADRQYLTIAGYNQTVGTPSPNGQVGNRTVGRIDMLGNVNTTTILGDAASIGNVRSVVSDNGGGFWVTSSSGGMRYTTLGSTTASTQINSAAPTNLRVANIFSGQLYSSAASGTFQGVGTIGSGLPTTTGQTPSLLNGFPTAAGPSAYDYLFAGPNTLYVADDRSTGSGGGLQKWTLSAGTWSLTYTLASGLTAGLRGLTGVDDGAGSFIFYATTADAISALAGNKVVTITDLLSDTVLPGAAFSTLVTAPGNTAFRGIELVPEPSAFALAGLGGLALLAYRRRR